MKWIFYFTFFFFLLTGCKKYLDPKFAYEQPVFDFNIGNEKISCDSSIGKLDSFNLDSVKMRTTVGHFLIQNQEVIKIQIKGRSLGSYELDSLTYLQYIPLNDTVVYFSQSGKIVVWSYDKETKKIAADVNAQLEDKDGNKLNLTDGRFVNLSY